MKKIKIKFSLRISAIIFRYVATLQYFLKNNRYTRDIFNPGPLVLGITFLFFHCLLVDRDRTVSRRSEPSSRTALIGEQPNP